MTVIMKSRLYIPLILVALSCAILAVALWVGTSDGDSSSGTSSDVLENIATRTSIRAYTSEPVDEETVTALLKAGMAAPTAMNTQPWFFYVVRDRELMKSLAEVLPYAKMAADAAVLIVPCGDRERFLTGEGMTYWVQDVSAATENILLAAHAMGLGAVWTGVYPVRDRIADVSRILEMDSHRLAGRQSGAQGQMGSRQGYLQIDVFLFPSALYGLTDCGTLYDFYTIFKKLDTLRVKILQLAILEN